MFIRQSMDTEQLLWWTINRRNRCSSQSSESYKVNVIKFVQSDHNTTYMYLTKIAQISDEKKFLHQNGDKNFTKKITGVSDDVSSQVRSVFVVIYYI